jgi:serine/threonine-protein kinase
MLAGEAPFKGPTPQMTLMLRLMHPPRPLRPTVNITEGVESAILKALAKDPADRWATASQFSDALAGRLPAPPPTAKAAPAPTAAPAPATAPAPPPAAQGGIAGALRRVFRRE